MDPILAAELAKLVIFGAMSVMQQAGCTPEQMEEAFQKSRVAFLALDPNNLISPVQF